jgi:hypothetical protein
MGSPITIAVWKQGCPSTAAWTMLSRSNRLVGDGVLDVPCAISETDFRRGGWQSARGFGFAVRGFRRGARGLRDNRGTRGRLRDDALESRGMRGVGDASPYEGWGGAIAIAPYETYK